MPPLYNEAEEQNDVQYTERSTGNTNYRLFDPSPSPIEPYRKQTRNDNARATWGQANRSSQMRRGSDNSPKRRGSSPWKPKGESPNRRTTWKKPDNSPSRNLISKDPFPPRRGTDASSPSNLSKQSGLFPRNQQPPSEYSDF